ncbi:hypothetical protein FOPE_00568 [Fonsecaea pedrosoi]|nr:hypothetical protein FOPE_00568 [Fonsecaea pedrosoi]
MTAAKTPSTSAAELPNCPAAPASGTVVVAAAVGASDVELGWLVLLEDREEEEEVICSVTAGIKLELEVDDRVAELIVRYNSVSLNTDKTRVGWQTHLKVILLANMVLLPDEAIPVLVGLIRLAVALPEDVGVVNPESEIVDVPLPPAIENKPL